VSLTSALKPAPELSSGRFGRTGYLPTVAGVLFLLVLVWAGAPGRRVRFSRAWQTMNQLGAGEILLIVFGVALLALLLQPLQLTIVRVMEGDWPRWLGSGVARNLQRSRRKRLDTRVTAAVGAAAANPAGSTERDTLTQQAGTLSTRLRTRYPRADQVRPTALGNALAAAESTAGAGYGLDAVVIWPRLYPVLGAQTRAVVDDLRDGLDAAARFAATGAFTAFAAFGLLVFRSGWWTLLALAPAAVAVLGYSGAVRAAVAYGTGLHVAFDLHRFDLLRALRLELPVTQDAEVSANRTLSDFLRQGVPVPFTYVDPPADDKNDKNDKKQQ
jgi:hypothetical protein